MSWFQKEFGFNESDYNYQDIQKQFVLEDNNRTLISINNNKKYNIGTFECLSLKQLVGELKDVNVNLGKLTFKNISGDIVAIHKNINSDNCVVQAASQFNCLEMPEPSVTPECGITGYMYDPTQGPKCAIACPAGTVYRNYYYNGGQTKNKQINNLDDVEAILGNKQWEMENGYAFPIDEISLRSLSSRLKNDKILYENVYNALKIGIHWDLEVNTKNSINKLCQIQSSALPISYSDININEQEIFAEFILNATQECVIVASILLAAKYKNRIKVYLTKIGGGVFGNKISWISKAISKALHKQKNYPLDVELLHYSKNLQDLDDDFKNIFTL